METVEKELSVKVTDKMNVTDTFSEDWTICNKELVSKKQEGFSIPFSELAEKDWIKHLLTKDWIDMNTFLPAYFYALRLCGKKEISITANYSLDINSLE